MGPRPYGRKLIVKTEHLPYGSDRGCLTWYAKNHIGGLRDGGNITDKSTPQPPQSRPTGVSRRLWIRDWDPPVRLEINSQNHMWADCKHFRIGGDKNEPLFAVLKNRTHLLARIHYSAPVRVFFAIALFPYRGRSPYLISANNISCYIL